MRRWLSLLCSIISLVLYTTMEAVYRLGTIHLIFFYENEAYVCNDRQILSLNHLEPSDSAYLVFFVRGH